MDHVESCFANLKAHRGTRPWEYLPLSNGRSGIGPRESVPALELPLTSLSKTAEQRGVDIEVDSAGTVCPCIASHRIASRMTYSLSHLIMNFYRRLVTMSAKNLMSGELVLFG